MFFRLDLDVLRAFVLLKLLLQLEHHGHHPAQKFSYCHLEYLCILFCDIIHKELILRGNRDHHHILLHRVGSKRLKPGVVNDIRDLIFLTDACDQLIPVILNKLYCIAVSIYVHNLNNSTLF